MEPPGVKDSSSKTAYASQRARAVDSGAPRGGRGGHRTGRVSREDWLTAGLEVLAEGGSAAVQVEKLSATLKVSRSGFYWHFGNREAFLAELRDYWATEFTENIVVMCEDTDLPPREKFMRASRVIRSNSAEKFDLSLWSWAKADEDVRELVDAITKRRTSYIGSLIEALGYEGEELEARTRMFVVYHSWASTMYGVGLSGRDSAITDRILEIIAGT